MDDNIVDFPQHSDLDRQFLELEQQQELIRNQRAEIMEKEQDNYSIGNSCWLTPAQQSELKFLKQQVDMWGDKARAKDPMPYAANNLFAAREELTRYVSDLRTWGKKI